MASELRDQIVHLIDTEAPPIDVAALARQLAGSSDRDDFVEIPVTTTIHRVEQGGWRRNRVGAFVVAFAGVIVVVGLALVVGMVLNDPSRGEVGGSPGIPAAPVGRVDAWWIVLGVAVVGIGALVAWRRRPTAGEEPVMQTIERTEQPVIDPQVEHLTGQRRWLIIALAVVVVLAAVGIGWLIAENRGLSDDLVVATTELADEAPTVAEQAKIDMMEDYFATLTAGNVEGLSAFHEETASITYDGVTYDLAGWQAFLKPYASSGSWEWSVFNTTALETGEVVTTFLMASPSTVEFYPHVAVMVFGPNGDIQRIETFEVR